MSCMDRVRVFLIIGALLIIVSSNAPAVELKSPISDSITIDENMRFLYDMTSDDPEEHFYALINRLNLQGTKGDFLYGIRYDVEAYFEKETYSIKYVPEKIFFQIDRRNWDLRLGDFYTSLGRGLTLTVLKNDQFGEDTTIQGAIGNFKTNYFSMRLLGGFVNEGDSLDFKPERAQKPEPEFGQRDLLFGTAITTGHPNYFILGGNFVHGELPVPEDAEHPEFEDADSIDLFSATLEAPDFWYGNFFGEYSWLEYKNNRQQLDDEEYEGRGAYAGLTFYGGPITIIGEYQDYFLFDFEYHEPPNLEYEKTTFTHGPITDDLIGTRGRLDVVVPGPETLLYGAYYCSWTHDWTPDPLVNSLDDHYSKEGQVKWVEHAYGGIEQIFSNAAFLFGSGGFREISEGRWVHGEIDAGGPVANQHQLSAGLHVKQFEGRGFDEGTEYVAYAGILEYAFSPYLIITGTYENSDEPTAAGVEETDKKDPHFYSGQIMIEPVQQVRIGLFYGREKGGLQCVGGMCRTVPPFEGARLDLQLRF